MTLPSSTAFQMDIAGTIVTPDAPLDFGAVVTGAYTSDAEAYQAAVETFSAITLRDVSLGDVVTVLDGMVSSRDAELSIDLSGTPQIAPLLGGETIDLYIVDGVAYADLTLVGTFLGDPTIAGAYGIDLFEAIDFGLSSITMGDLGTGLEALAEIDPMDFADLMSGDATGDNPFAAGFQQGLNNAALDIAEEDLMGFVSIERLDDETVDGENAIVFQTTIDAAGAFDVPAIREATISGIEQQDLPDDFDPEAVTDAIAAAIQGSTILVTERYSEDTGFLLGADFTMDMTINPAPLAKAFGETLGEDDTPIDMTINFARSNINGVEAIVLPDGAQVVPIMELLGGF